jgi:large subunit ribosomal protein L35Ae
MEGKIANFRGSRRVKKGNQVIILSSEKAEDLVGKNVEWVSSSGKKITGKITGIHGKKGAVRALFERGLPGQSLGQKVIIS